MKNHLKRIAAPRTWAIDRKAGVYTTRPKPGAHSLDCGLPLGIVLRDMLHLAHTMPEAKKLLNNNDVLIDGTRRKSHRFMVGLFDVVSFPSLKKQYRMTLDVKGRLTIQELDEKERELKLCKVVGKSVLPKGKIQYNLHDGKNITGDIKAKVGDTVLLTLPKADVKDVFSREKGAAVFLVGGKGKGNKGTLQSVEGDDAVYDKDGATIETATEHLFVIGKGKPALTFN